MTATAATAYPAPIHEQLGLALYTVSTSPYASLDLAGLVYPHWIVSHVRAGDVETSTRGQTWRARAGDVMIHPPDLPFSEAAAGPGTHQWLVCQLTVAPSVDLFRLHAVAPVVTLRDPAAYTRTFEALQAIWQSAAPFRELRAAGLLAQLVGLVLESWHAGGGTPRPPALRAPQDRFAEVISYMAQHLDEKLTRDHLAAKVHLHPGYFHRAFQQAYGHTPMQMLRDMRLQRARQLLESGDAPLSAIAAACGLGDAAYFSRVFRQRYGQTPGDYRKSAQNTIAGYVAPLPET
jgi:AraC-like DNA-binding protein